MKAFVILPAMYSVLFLHYLALVQAGQFSEQMGLESFFLGQTSSSQELDMGKVRRFGPILQLDSRFSPLCEQPILKKGSREIFDSCFGNSHIVPEQIINRFIINSLSACSKDFCCRLRHFKLLVKILGLMGFGTKCMGAFLAGCMVADLSTQSKTLRPKLCFIQLGTGLF